MKGIVFDTTDKALVAVAVNGDKSYSYVGSPESQRHTGEILTATETALANVGLAVNDLEVVGCVVGPGSFTGIRIGVSTATAIATALNAKTVEITSLEVPAFGKGDVLSLLDCKHGYYAMLRRGSEAEYKALEYAEADAIDLPKCYVEGANPQDLKNAFVARVQNEQWSEGFKPFYLKASSAEK